MPLVDATKQVNVFVRIFKSGRYPIILAIIGIVVYANALFNGFVWDDKTQIVENLLIRDLSNIGRIFAGSTFYQGGTTLAGLYYRPVTTTVISLLYSLFGSNALAFHFFSVILHILNTVLVFILLKRLLSKNNLAFFLSLIFLVHPINTEVVDYASSMGDLLSFSFGIGAFLLFTRKREISVTTVIFSSMLFLISLLSKETGALFLIAAAAYRAIFNKEFKSWIIPAISSISVYSFLRIFVARLQTRIDPSIPIMSASFAEKILTAPKIVAYYLGTFFFPLNLAISQHWVVRTVNFVDFFLPLIVIIIFSGVLALLYSKIRKDKEKDYVNIFFFCLVIFLAGVGAHLHIVPLFETVADRWFYVPSIGLLGLIGLSIKLLNKSIATFPKHLIVGLGILIISVLAIRTIVRNFNWNNEHVLYNHDVLVNPTSYGLQNDVGNELYSKGDLNGAKTHFEIAVAENPKSVICLRNLGNVYFQLGNTPQAVYYFQKMVEASNDDAFTYENYARFLVTYVSPANARDFVQNSLLKFPNDSSLWATLAVSYSRLNSANEALVAAKKAYELDPNGINITIYKRLQKGIKL